MPHLGRQTGGARNKNLTGNEFDNVFAPPKPQRGGGGADGPNAPVSSALTVPATGAPSVPQEAAAIVARTGEGPLALMQAGVSAATAAYRGTVDATAQHQANIAVYGPEVNFVQLRLVNKLPLCESA